MSSPFFRLVALLASVAAFIAVSGSLLPPVVASHFSQGGVADGFMPRDRYLVFMLAMAVALPLAMALLHGVVRALPLRFVNLPNREYWLAPERAPQTMDAIAAQGTRFAAMLALFLAFVHGLVVVANRSRPPELPAALLVAGVAVFVTANIAWIGLFLARFRLPPDERGGRS